LSQQLRDARKKQEPRGAIRLHKLKQRLARDLIVTKGTAKVNATTNILCVDASQ
jgi:hypothetical protein